MMNERVVSHPGTYISDAIEVLGMTQNEFAIRTGILPKTITTLTKGTSSITYDIAFKLSEFFGNSTEFWINLQTKYNDYLVMLEKEKTLTEEWNIVKLFDNDWLKNICTTKINQKNKEEVITEMKQKLLVTSLANLKSPDMFSFCRTSVNKDINDSQIILRNAWVSYAMYLSKNIQCNEYSADKLKEYLPKIRSLTLSEPNYFISRLRSWLCEVGIKLVILPYLKGSNISGVTRWLPNENSILIAINDYGKDADKFWFNLFHELGHAIKNHKRHLTLSLVKNNINDKDELDANLFAEDELIPRVSYNDFVKANDFSITAIKKFANAIEIADFIVIGRLQKDTHLKWSDYNSYKPSYTISFSKENI